MRCITYAIRKFIRHGGYISIRPSRRDDGKLNPWLIHVLQADKLEGVRQLTTDDRTRPWFKELLCCLTGTHYVEKFNDNDHTRSKNEKDET